MCQTWTFSRQGKSSGGNGIKGLRGFEHNGLGRGNFVTPLPLPQYQTATITQLLSDKIMEFYKKRNQFLEIYLL